MSKHILAQRSAQQLAQALCQLQKQQIKIILLGEQAAQHQRQFIDFIFQHAKDIQLQQVLSLEQLLGVVDAQALQVNLAPPLLGMIGEIIQSVHEQFRHNHMPLASFISDQQIEHWLRKVLEMDAIFDYLKDKIAHTPQIQALCAYWINQNIQRYTPATLTTIADKAIRRLPQAVQFALLRSQQRVEEKIEEKAAQLFQQQLLFLLQLPQEEYLNLGVAVWQNLKHKPISEFAAQGSSIDSEDFFILLYEFWKDFRENSLVQQVIHSGVQLFYRTFAEESLFYLFSATGLTMDDIYQENQRFTLPLLQHLEQLGMLDQLLDLYLDGFFKHTLTLQLIEQYMTKQSS